MDVVVVGGGMAGLVLARALSARGIAPVVLERRQQSARIPGPIMLPFQAFDALQDLGLYDEIRRHGHEIAPGADGTPVAIGVGRQRIVDVLTGPLAVRHEHEVIDLLRDGERVVGVRVRGPGGEEDLPTDLVVGADGALSPVRGMAGIHAEVTPAPGAQLSFRSPVQIDEPFAMTYMSDGRQVGMIGWQEGCAVWRQIDRIGEEAAKAPGIEAYKRNVSALLPDAARAAGTLQSMDQVIYREATEVRCETWWVPGVVLIGEAAHAINPEAGIGAGLGFGDALALAVAIASSPDDADAACRDYEFWRRPTVAPYEAIGGAGARVARGGDPPAVEAWPPAD